MSPRAVKILIADDETGIRKLLAAIVNELGAGSDIAHNGREAFRMATTGNYDLVLMDIAMPDWNGIDAIRSLKLVKPEQKIIVISAYLDDDIVKELGEETNVLCWFKKPIDVDEVMKKISESTGLPK